MTRQQKDDKSIHRACWLTVVANAARVADYGAGARRRSVQAQAFVAL